MRPFLFALILLAVSAPVAIAQQPQVIDSVVIKGPALETPRVTPLEVAQSLDAVRKEIAAAKETYGEESAQVRLLTEILHNLEGTFRQQLTDRGMILTAEHQEAAEHEGHGARGGQHHGHNDEAIAQLTRQVRELRAEVEKLKQSLGQAPLHDNAPSVFPGPEAALEAQRRDERRREYFRRLMESHEQGRPQVDGLGKARERIAQLERENAALRQRGSAPTGPRAERVLNALRDQTLQHQAEATKRIEQSFEQMQRRLQELEQSQPTERPRADRPRDQRRGEEQRRPEERRRDARPPRTSSAQPL